MSFFLELPETFLTFGPLLLAVENLLSSWTLNFENLQQRSVDIRWSAFPLNMDLVEHMALMITEPNKDMSVFLHVEKWKTSHHLDQLEPNRVYILKVVGFTGTYPENITYSSQSISINTPPGGKTRDK